MHQQVQYGSGHRQSRCHTWRFPLRLTTNRHFLFTPIVSIASLRSLSIISSLISPHEISNFLRCLAARPSCTQGRWSCPLPRAPTPFYLWKIDRSLFIFPATPLARSSKRAASAARGRSSSNSIQLTPMTPRMSRREMGAEIGM